MWYTVLISDVKNLSVLNLSVAVRQPGIVIWINSFLEHFLKIQQSPGSTPLESKRIDPIQLNWLGQTPQTNACTPDQERCIDTASGIF